MRYHIFFFIVILFSIYSADAKGDPVDSIKDYRSLLNYVLNEYGIDQYLVNGIFYEDKYHQKKGHQFLLDDKLYNGKIIYRGKEYTGLNLKYDIYEQQIILFINDNNEIAWIVPSNDFITAFCIENMCFLKYDFQGEPKYYQSVYESDKLKCVYYWYKEKHDANQEDQRIYHEFTNSQKKKFLNINGKFSNYTRNKSFVELFPDEIKNEIIYYIRNKNINVSKCRDDEISELLTFCYSLL